MAEELKPCPFCGGEAEIVEVRDNPPETIAIQCKSGCGISVHHKWMEESVLVERWNTRAERTTRFELLATEVDKNGDALAIGVHCVLCGFLDEDAIGVDPDNWMLWRYCPSCGAKVVI